MLRGYLCDIVVLNAHVPTEGKSDNSKDRHCLPATTGVSKVTNRIIFWAVQGTNHNMATSLCVLFCMAAGMSFLRWYYHHEYLVFLCGGNSFLLWNCSTNSMFKVNCSILFLWISLYTCMLCCALCRWESRDAVRVFQSSSFRIKQLQQYVTHQSCWSAHITYS